MCDDLTLDDNQRYAQTHGQLNRRQFVAGMVGASLAMYLPLNANAMSVTESTVNVATPDGTADCYFVHPASGKYPAVILWPDILGLRQTDFALDHTLDLDFGFDPVRLKVREWGFHDAAASNAVDDLVQLDFDEGRGQYEVVENGRRRAADPNLVITAKDALALLTKSARANRRDAESAFMPALLPHPALLSRNRTGLNRF